jgi:hypothetical protein
VVKSQNNSKSERIQKHEMPLVENPFKKIKMSGNGQIEDADQKSVSLNDLSKKKKEDSKLPKPENKNSLKEALASVLKNSETPEKKENPPKKEIPKNEEQPQKIQNKQESNTTRPKEIPEDVLKKILEVDD